MRNFDQSVDAGFAPTEYVLWGGGTGTSAIAEGFVDEVGDHNATFLIGTADSGSRNGRLRTLLTSESGIPVPALSDLRKVMSAVSANDVSEIFEIRMGDDATPNDVRNYAGEILNRASFKSRMSFDDRLARGAAENAMDIAGGIADLVQETDGSLKGYMVGNLALAGLFMHYDGDLGRAVQDASSWLETRATVLPITNDPYHLVMNYKGETFFGEGVIDDLEIDEPEVARLSLEAVLPKTGIRLYEPARQAIIHGKNVIVPGSYFTTHGGVLLIPGTTEALQENAQRGKKFGAVANLEVGRDIRGLSLERYVKGLGAMAGREIDVVVANRPETLPEGKVPLKPDGSDMGSVELITAALLDTGAQVVAEANDPIAELRSDLRTDGRQVARALTDAIAA